MALKIRLQRKGATHRPIYHIVVAESSNRRDGRLVEKLGVYNPQARGSDPKLRLNTERVEYWQSVGAKPTDTAKGLIRKASKENAEDGVVTLAAAASA